MSTYNFPNHLKDDTFQGVTFTVLVNSVPLDLTDSSIRMGLRGAGGSLEKTFVVGSGITLTMPASGIFTFNKQIIDLPAQTYTYDIQFTLNTGEVYTYISGEWMIVQDVTNV